MGVVLWTIVVLVVTVGLMVVVTVMFTQALGTMRTIKLEPKRMDNTPVVRCQECGSSWIDSTSPIHEYACAVAYVKGEAQRMKPRLRDSGGRYR